MMHGIEIVPDVLKEAVHARGGIDIVRSHRLWQKIRSDLHLKKSSSIHVCYLHRWFSARLFSLDNCVFHSFYSKGIVSVIFTRNTADLFISIIYITIVVQFTTRVQIQRYT